MKKFLSIIVIFGIAILLILTWVVIKTIVVDTRIRQNIERVLNNQGNLLQKHHNAILQLQKDVQQAAGIEEKK